MLRSKILALLLDIRVWMLKRWLKLNDGKTEVWLLEGRTSLLELMILEIAVDGANLIPTNSLRNSEILFDESLNFVKHVHKLHDLSESVCQKWSKLVAGAKGTMYVGATV